MIYFTLLFYVVQDPVDTSPVTEGVTLFKYRLLIIFIIIINNNKKNNAGFLNYVEKI